MPFLHDLSKLTYDAIDEANIVILSEHALEHKGLLFSVTYKFAAIPSGATAYLMFTTPPNAQVHFKQSLITTDAEKISVSITEGATASGGDTLTVFNRNRNSTNAALSIVKANVTGVTGGTIIDIDYLGGGASAGPKAVAIGTEVAGVTEWILKPNTNYVISLVNDGASEASAIVKLLWYEIS